MRPPRLLIALLAILVAAAIVWRISTRSRVTRPDAEDAATASESPATSDAPSAETHPAIEPRLVWEDDVESVDSGSEDAAPAAVSDPLKVRILVVDAAGVRQPGVPVATVNPVLVATRRGVTGPDGIAEVGVPFRKDAGRDGSTDPRIHTVIAIPIDPPVFQVFDPRAVPDAPIKLVLPPTGAVRVRLVTPDGTAFDATATVTLDFADDGWDAPLPSAAIEASPVAGSVLFERVGLSQDLTVEVKPKDPALRTVIGNLPAPRERGAETVLTLTSGGPALLMSGRLVTPEGDPIGNRRMTVDLCGGSLSNSTRSRAMQTRTDDGGRFSLRFDLDPASALPGEVRVEVALDGAPGRATIRLPETAIGGEFDTGDIIVAPPMLLAAGRVVDGGGHPVEHAMVVLDKSGGWRTSTAITVSSADGRFELRGATGDTSVTITAVRSGWICLMPTLCDRGAKDIRVAMTRAGGLAGAVTDIDWLRMRLQPPMHVVVAGTGVDAVARVLGGSHPAGMELPIFWDGSFSASGLLPGRYSVLFLGVGVREPLLVVNDVVIVGGEVNCDPRLQNVELASFMKMRMVTVLDEQQRPLAEASVGARVAGGARGSFATFMTESDGRARMMMPPGPLELVAVRRGYRPELVTMTTESVTVTMKKAVPRPVTIRLIEDCALLFAPFQLQTDVRYLGPLTGSSPRESDPTDPRNDLGGDFTALGRSTQVTVGEPGIYEVRLWLYYAKQNGDECGEPIAQTGGNPIVTVGEFGDTSVTVAPDPKALEQAIERARIR